MDSREEELGPIAKGINASLEISLRQMFGMSLKLPDEEKEEEELGPVAKSINASLERSLRQMAEKSKLHEEKELGPVAKSIMKNERDTVRSWYEDDGTFKKDPPPPICSPKIPKGVSLDDYRTFSPKKIYMENEFLINVKWDTLAELEETSKPKGETLDLHIEALNDPGVIDKRSEWLKDLLSKVYTAKFEKHISIEMGLAIQSEERKIILSALFHTLYEVNKVTILKYKKSFGYHSLRLYLTMDPREDGEDESERLDHYIKRLASLPTMHTED